MHLDHLRYFVELAHAGSFARASQALIISSQGLNKAIGALEGELGVALVVRGNRGTVLTPDGELFLAYAEDALARYDAMVGELAASKHAAIGDGPFTIGATSYALHTVFQEPVGFMGSRSVRIQEMGPTEIADAVAAGDPRLFVTDLLDGSSLAARCRETGAFHPIFRTDFGVIYHENYTLASKTLTVEDLRRMPLVCFHDESIDWVMEKFLGGAQADNVLLRSSNFEQLLKHVISQSAVSLLDSFAYTMMGVARTSQASSIKFAPVAGLPKSTTGFFHNPNSSDLERLNLYMDAYMISFRRRYSGYLRRYPLQ